jgi:serine/threonine protein kinase
VSEFDRQLDQNEIDLLGSLYDEIEVEQFKTVEEEIRDIESRYTCRKFLAEGGLKVIQSAVDIVTGREVALAIPRDSEDTIIREKFFREARLTASLQHPNIVPVYDLGLDNIDQPYFAMKLIKGETLKNQNKKKALSISENLSIFMKVCDAMSYTHSQGIVHLDLKPDNIQISSFGEVSVCDWGLAKVVGGLDTDDGFSKGLDQFEIDNMTLDGVVKGTPGYMAPEQISGETKTYQTDIYALGAILFEMLYLVTPVRGNDLMEIIKNTVAGDIQTPDKEVPLPLKAVALKALSVEPENRYESVERLQEEIKNYLSGHATKAENAGIGRLFFLLLKRNKAISLTLIISFILLVTSTLKFISNLKESEKEARGLLYELQQENKKKLELAEDAEPLLSAKIIVEMNAYEFSKAEESITKLLKLLPNSKKGRLFTARLSFLQGDYPKALKNLQEPESEVDVFLLRYLKSARQKSNKVEFVDGLFSIHHHGAMKYLRSFYQSRESRGVEKNIESIASKWRFVQDCWHLLELTKQTDEETTLGIMKRIHSLISRSNWDESPELAYEAAKAIEPGDLRERFLRLFTRNIALMKKIEASGSTLSPVFHAVDGKKLKMSNRWEAGPCPVYMTLDLGEMRSFNKILIYFKRSSTISFQYKVSYSQDGKVFKNFIDGSENRRVETLHPLTHRFPSVTGRYIRLTVLGNSKEDRAYVREFEVYQEVKNLALAQYCNQGKVILENLTNGTGYTGAYSKIMKGKPVEIDLGEVCDIGAAKVSFKFKEKLKYDLAVSIDRKKYTTVKTLNYDQSNWLKNETVRGRYLKFYFLEDRLIYINEIRVKKP